MTLPKVDKVDACAVAWSRDLLEDLCKPRCRLMHAAASMYPINSVLIRMPYLPESAMLEVRDLLHSMSRHNYSSMKHMARSLDMAKSSNVVLDDDETVLIEDELAYEETDVQWERDADEIESIIRRFSTEHL